MKRNVKLVILSVLVLVGGLLAFSFNPVLADEASDLKERELKRIREFNTREVGEVKKDKVISVDLKSDRERLKAQSEQEREELKTRMEQEREHLKTRLEQEREELKTKIEREHEELKNRIELKREEVKNKIEQEREQLKQKLEKIKDENKKRIVESIDKRMDELNEKMMGHYLSVLDKLGEVLIRISERADRAEERGMNVASVRTAIESAEKSIAAARLAVEKQSSKTYTVQVNTEIGLKNDVGRARQALHNDLTVVKSAVKSAHEAVRNAATTLAKLPKPTVSPSPTPTASPTPEPAGNE